MATVQTNLNISTNALFGVVGSISRSAQLGGSDVAVVGCGNFTRTGFTAYFDALDNDDAYVSTSVTWIAVCK